MKMKIIPDPPKNESGIAKLIKMGKSTHLIWVIFFFFFFDSVKRLFQDYFTHRDEPIGR